MKVIDHINQAISEKQTAISFEVLPPARGNGIESLFEHLDTLIDLNPVFINVTYHRRELKKIQENGKSFVRQSSRRPGTIGISATLQHRFNVTTVMHLICGGFTKEETEDALIELSYLGVNNVLALRGDGLAKDNKVFFPTEGGHDYALGLVEQIEQLNKGRYIDNTLSGSNTDFCIGIAAYPEKHFEAKNLQEDITYLKQKVAAGASYAITQMFFDNQYYFDYVKRCREEGINIPIIPGLKPITKKRHLEVLPRLFYTDIPKPLYEAVMNAKDDKEVEIIGSEWLAHQVRELKDHQIPVVHFYTVGSVVTPIRDAILSVF